MKPNLTDVVKICPNCCDLNPSRCTDCRRCRASLEKAEIRLNGQIQVQDGSKPGYRACKQCGSIYHQSLERKESKICDDCLNGPDIWDGLHGLSVILDGFLRVSW